MSDPPQANNPPVNLLSLDGGGIRGVSELIVLHEIMVRVQDKKNLSDLPKPCEYFHLIGGTSTGGLIAIMLGRLELSTEEALAQYKVLAGRIFGKKNQKSKGHDGAFKATTLEGEIKKLLQNCREDPETLMCGDTTRENERGKAFVCAVPASNMRFPRLFRTYKLSGNSDPNCKIWQAARATTAAPTFFKRISIPGVGGIEETFIDAGIRCNNPAEQVREEAKRLFGENRTVGVFVSIGTGHPGTIGLSKPDVFQRILPSQLISTLKNIATDCESVADQLANRYGEREDSVYFRFNVTHGVGQISLEEWEKISEIVTHTRAYLQDSRISSYVDSVVQRLCDPSSYETGVSLALLCGQIPRQMVGSEQVPLELVSTSYEPYESATMFGRDDEKTTLVTTLCKGHAHVIILGGGGMGKTTLALSALCDIEVIKKHPSRHFISCEGIYSVEALLPELANALRIRKRENLHDEVLTLLCRSLNPLRDNLGS
ncbi:FabD/lysophospholipase-like protein [Dendrothele bispora CBS 962.96]|uniref:FabD/lysophospholipase-like protein n=1 Tax=Dendrothele bispora (strain CBS 962.96) TaxID=1314807 RepID=A0A4S8M2P1_DENBC|nr:FabD/lysophospholipase-like protein [Dendrothele bispora CBS 962.96]